jgi:voltage-gated potassium channel
MKVEGRSFVDSVYFVVATITTVGYGDIVAETLEGKLLSVFLMILGVGAVLSLIPLAFSYFLERGIRISLGLGSVPKLKDHIIICRYNELSGEAIEEIKEHGLSFIVIEDDEDRVRELRELDLPFINGDPSEERILEKASTRSALSAILASKNDSENVFVAMAAKNLNPNIRLIGIVNTSENTPIYEKVEIDKIIDPHDISLKILSKNALSPYAADLLDKISLFADINLGQFQVTADSPLLGKTIQESEFRNKSGASIVAIWRKNEIIPNPSSSEIFEENDVLLVLGTSTQLKEAKALIEKGTRKKKIKELREEKKLKQKEAANEIRVRLPKVALNTLLILGFLFAVTVVFPSMAAVWNLIPPVGTALGTLLPITAWIVIALLVFRIAEDIKVLFEITSEAVTGLFPGVEGLNLRRAMKDIIYAAATVIFFTLLSPFISGTPTIVRSFFSIVTIIIPILFLYDAGRILYGQLAIIVDRITEKVAGELEKK